MVTFLVILTYTLTIIFIKNIYINIYVMRNIRIIYKAFYFDIIDPINPLLGFI